MHESTVDHRPGIWRYLSPQAYFDLPASGGERPAIAVIHGDLALPERPWPQIRSKLPQLGGDPRVEVMLISAPSRFERHGRFDVLTTADFLVAACRLEETDGGTLAERSQRLYDELLRLIHLRGYEHILRIWNILEDINRIEHGLERYRQFCLGRHEAYVRNRPDLAGRFPAASAVGSAEGGLCVYCIAARDPGMPIENPSQVSAFRYPRQYGPRSPSFSRALVKSWPESGRTNLYISGTASIIGHETRHLGDLDAQVALTIDNLETVVAEAVRKSAKAFAFRGAGCRMKAYVRRPEDFPQIRDGVVARWGDAVEVLYLCADICREPLLVEIEGVLST